MNINVAFGYLSVLLGYLSLSEAIRDDVCLQLKGGTLQQLLDSIEEFLRYHKQIAKEILQIDEDTDLKVNFIVRVEKVVDRLKQ